MMHVRRMTDCRRQRAQDTAEIGFETDHATDHATDRATDHATDHPTDHETGRRKPRSFR